LTRYFASDPTDLRLSVSAVVCVQPGAREVREETGWSVEVGRLVGVYSDPARQVIEYPDQRRVQAVNLCFEALAREPGELGTPGEVLGVGFFACDALPQPFVPIHEIRIADWLAVDSAARVR